jgi:hypothetical protein
MRIPVAATEFVLANVNPFSLITQTNTEYVASTSVLAPSREAKTSSTEAE